MNGNPQTWMRLGAALGHRFDLPDPLRLRFAPLAQLTQNPRPQTVMLPDLISHQEVMTAYDPDATPEDLIEQYRVEMVVWRDVAALGGRILVGYCPELETVVYGDWEAS